jgi:Outer membrane protein Omp28
MLFKQFPLVIFAAVGLILGCEEINPGIKFTEAEKALLDTNYVTGTIPAAQSKNVMLFDITGVRCNNCPDAAAIARKIADTLNPGRVTVVALYPTSISPILTKPWPGYDTMNNDDAEALTGILGTVPSLPTGCIDQIKISNTHYLDRGTWNGHVNNQLAKSTPLNIDLATSWLAADNKGRLEVKVTYTSAVAVNHVILIGVTESEIIGKQSDVNAKPNGYRDDYEHNHALRKLYTAAAGDTLKAALTAGRVFEKHYFIKPRYNWKPEHLDCVVWVVDASTKEIIHSAHMKLKK